MYCSFTDLDFDGSSSLRPILQLITSPVVGKAKYCNDRVYLFVCLTARLSSELHVRSSPFYACYLYPRTAARSSSGGVAIMLYTSGFMDYVIFTLITGKNSQPARLNCSKAARPS